MILWRTISPTVNTTISAIFTSSPYQNVIRRQSQNECQIQVRDLEKEVVAGERDFRCCRFLNGL